MAVAALSVQFVSGAALAGLARMSDSRRLRRPYSVSHRNASEPRLVVASPTTTRPSAETAYALLLKSPPSRSPSPDMPAPWTHRMASPLGVLRAEMLWPTTTVPSDDT